jgi:hypothetical protein
VAYLLLGLLALVALVALGRVFVDAKPGEVKRALAWAGGVLGVLLVGLLVYTGRAGQAIWALALFGPLLWRWFQGLRAARRFARGGAPSPGGASDVETSHLAMGLDHESGRMFGRVKSGRFAGADLADFDLDGLLELLAEIAAQDRDGVPLLEAWLDRAHPEWRDAARAPPPASGGPMTRAEAYAVLGLPEGADEAAIRAAHRRLMRTAHPDSGGSDWMAARLNEARDVLIGG